MENTRNTDDIYDYTLPLGQFAKLCGTTRDTLRHYYEQNILNPRIDPENGYHYYSASQISSFYFISTMRQAGCSIKEISDIIHNSSRGTITEIVNSKIDDMKKELFLINKKISSLNLGMWILEKYEAHLSCSPYIDTLPNISIVSTPVSDKAHARGAGDIAHDIKSHLLRSSSDNSLSSFPSGVTIQYDDLLKQNFVYNSIISLSLLDPDMTDSFPLTSSKALCCFHDHESDNIENTYKKMLAYIKKSRLKVCSDLYSVSLINLYNKEKPHTYIKYLFICIK